MKVQLVYIDACPSWVEADARTRAALDELGQSEVTIEHVLIRTSEDATGIAFAGSPTILLDGEDAFPSEGRTTQLSCRVYPTESGLAGAPTQRQIREAIVARG